MSDVFEALAVLQPTDHVLQVAFNRPAAMNCINTQTRRDLVSVFTIWLDAMASAPSS
jgi:enoyl-CoA hydratase/carnithine racemase